MDKSRMQTIVKLLQDYESSLKDDSNYCLISAIRFSVGELQKEITMKEKIEFESGALEKNGETDDHTNTVVVCPIATE